MFVFFSIFAISLVCSLHLTSTHPSITPFPASLTLIHTSPKTSQTPSTNLLLLLWIVLKTHRRRLINHLITLPQLPTNLLAHHTQNPIRTAKFRPSIFIIPPSASKHIHPSPRPATSTPRPRISNSSLNTPILSYPIHKHVQQVRGHAGLRKRPRPASCAPVVARGRAAG